MRLHRHAKCLLNQWLPEELSLAQTQFKSDATPDRAAQQLEPKLLIGEDYLPVLNALVENVIIYCFRRLTVHVRRSDQR
jgi:hypothetical protein